MIISLKKLFLLLLLFFFTQATLERSKDDARDPCYYTRRVKEAINIRLLPDNINRDSGIEIPEAWMPTIKNTTTGELCDSGPLREQITE